MQIWSLCTKMFQKHKKKRKSIFLKEDGLQCQYAYWEIYLGAKSKVTFAENGIEVFISSSVRDGVLVKIKRKKPYRILFDYIDGSYLVNDERDLEYAQLIESLDFIKDESNNNRQLKMHDGVEEIVYCFLKKFFKTGDGFE